MVQHQSSPSAADEAPNRPQSTAADPGRLLVIDDDASICTLIGKLGEKAGFAAMHAASLDEATQLLHAHRFDCITLDLNIGKNSGVEVLGVLAKMACTTPIIVISGSVPSVHDLAAAVGDMMQLNLVQPIAKPIDFARLRATLAGIKQELDQQRDAKPAA